MQRLLEPDRIDYLVIETTGVANRLPIVMTFVGTELRELTRLDSVLGVVDAEMFGAALFVSLPFPSDRPFDLIKNDSNRIILCDRGTRLI